jgi:limonene 1,2-monooxygenase
MIGSPEMFLAAAGERSKRIKLATGVVSLPYHHPFNVAQRMVQLDYMTGGRVIFGSGPGALASDAHTLGIDPMLLRDRQDEAIGVIRRLMRGERLTVKSDWFTLQDAALQLLPLQEDMPFAVASQISPSGMTLAGKHGIGVISIGSLSEEGLNALPTQWSFAEAAAAEYGQTVDRKNWRVLMSWHIAATRDKARAEAREGLLRHHNEYITATLQRPGARPYRTPDEAVNKTAFVPGAVATIGTPDDLVERIKSVLEISGGFGTVVGFVHDWANPENTIAKLGHGGALRGAGDQRLSRRSANVSRIRRQQPRVLQPRSPGRDGEDHREPGRGRRARGHEVAAFARLVQQRARSEPGPRPPRVAVTGLA